MFQGFGFKSESQTRENEKMQNLQRSHFWLSLICIEHQSIKANKNIPFGEFRFLMKEIKNNQKPTISVIGISSIAVAGR